MLRLFLIFCPRIWLLDLIKIKELLRFDVIINVAQMQLKQVVAYAVQGRNIKSLVNKFEITGSVNDAPRSGRPITATSDEKGERLCASLINSPQKSVRRLSCELEISRQSVDNSSYCACSSHSSYNKIYRNLQLL